MENKQKPQGRAVKPSKCGPPLSVQPNILTPENVAMYNFKKCLKKPIPVGAIQMESDFAVATLEGVLSGKAGDYLMKGVRGEIYPCDKDIFEETYNFIKEE